MDLLGGNAPDLWKSLYSLIIRALWWNICKYINKQMKHFHIAVIRRLEIVTLPICNRKYLINLRRENRTHITLTISSEFQFPASFLKIKTYSLCIFDSDWWNFISEPDGRRPAGIYEFFIKCSVLISKLISVI